MTFGMRHFANLRIGWRLGLSYIALIAILATAVGLTQLRVAEVTTYFNRVVEERLPTSHASTRLAKAIHASLANLRGWMLTGKSRFKDHRAGVWQEIDDLTTEIDGLSVNWEDPDVLAEWARFKEELNHYRSAQAEVERIAHSTEQFPAKVLLADQAEPLATEMLDTLSKAIDIELALEATSERKILLGMMGEVRTYMTLSVASIRSFLLAENDIRRALYKEQFSKFWDKTDQRMEYVFNQFHMLSSEQIEVFTKFTTAQGRFRELPARIFEIAEKEGDRANFILVNKAVPQADKLLDILDGPENESFHRSGGLVDRQLLKLELDASTARSTSNALRQFLWALLAVGVILAAVVGLLITWSIVSPIQRMTQAMERLAEGQFSIEVPALGRRDEVGEMAKAVQVFKTNGEQIQVMQRNASSIVKTLSDTTGQVASAIGNQASTTSQQAAAVAQTSTALEEIGETARAAMVQAKELSEAAEQTLQRGESGRQDVEQVVQAMNDIRDRVEAIAHTMMALSEQTRRVGEITDSVNGLAQQSKMLAINASIEAAKAGEAGKGFAVVAEEVANLADQSEQATQQVRGVLDQIQAASEKAIFATEEGTKQVDVGVRLIQVVGSGMNDLMEVIDRTATATRQMVDSIRQQTAGIQQVAGAMDDITQGTGQIVESTEEIRHAVDGMSEEVQRLANSRG